MNKIFLLILSLLLIGSVCCAQMVEVHAEYNDVGDCVFSAENSAIVPLFLYVNFADIQNAVFDESLPYVKKVLPGYNSLFMLQCIAEAEGRPQFNYEIKEFRSKPTPKINLDFPYLIPLTEGNRVNVFDVKSIDGFECNGRVGTWFATGFKVNSAEDVFASRNGVVVEIVGNKSIPKLSGRYCGWTNSVTLLQPDGTLICYKNVTDKTKHLKIGEKVYAGQRLGEIAAGAEELVLLIYHESLSSKKLSFVLPRFVVSEGNVDMLNSSTQYTVVHPKSVVGLEMTKREKKKLLR